MKLEYYAESDSLYIMLRDAGTSETREVADSVNVDFDDAGYIVGFDIDHASSQLDLTTWEATALPFTMLGSG